MPIYEYRCHECRRRVSVWWRTFKEAETGTAHCPRCGSEALTRLVSKVRVIRSEESRLEVFNVGDSRENYRKKDIVETVAKYIPRVKIESQGIGPDPRVYKVSFEKIKKVLGFSITRDMEYGVQEVLKLINDKVITDFDNREYYNA